VAELTRDARQVLAEMELLSYGKAATIGGSTRGGDDRHPVPQGDARPLHDQWRAVFLRCAAHDLAELVREARRDMESVRRRDPATLVEPADDRDAWEVRLIEEGEGHEARDVAVAFSTSVQVVEKLRRKFKRDYLGYHLTQLPGESVRQMAARTGMSKSAIGRLVA